MASHDLVYARRLCLFPDAPLCAMESVPMDPVQPPEWQRDAQGVCLHFKHFEEMCTSPENILVFSKKMEWM